MPPEGEREKGNRMEINVFHLNKYGMRLRPYDSRSYKDCQPEDGLVCVADGGTVDGRRYHNFIYYIKRLDSETANNYDLDFLGVKLLKAEEL